MMVGPLVSPTALCWNNGEVSASGKGADAVADLLGLRDKPAEG
jgi:hypothetical protein